MTKLPQAYPHLQFIITEDRLRANAPHIKTLHAHPLHDIVGSKAGEHAWLFKHGDAADPAGRVTHETRHDRATGLVHRFRFVNQVPLHASNAKVYVNCSEYWEVQGQHVQPCSGGTDIRVSQRNVSRLMRGGRARWKSENDTCNTLKNQGYHFAHHAGHGTQNLSVVFALVMRLAFLVDHTQQRCCAVLQAVWAKLGSTRLLGERIRALFSPYAVASMRQRLEALFDGLKKPAPLFASDSS